MLCSSREAKSLVLHKEEAKEGVDQTLAVLVDVELERGSTSDGTDAPDAHEGTAEGEAEYKPAVLDVGELVQASVVERAPGVLAVVERGVLVDEADDEKSVVPSVLDRDGERPVLGIGVRGRTREEARLMSSMTAASIMELGQALEELVEPSIDSVRRGIGRPAEPLAISKERVFTMAALAIDLSRKSLETVATTTKFLVVEVGDVDEEGLRQNLKDRLSVRPIIKLHGVHVVVVKGFSRAVLLARGANESEGRVPDLGIRRHLHGDEDADDVLERVDFKLR